MFLRFKNVIHCIGKFRKRLKHLRDSFMWATTTGSFFYFITFVAFLLNVFLLVSASHVLSVHQEKNKERFKFQETYSCQEVYYAIQTRGLDLIYKKRKA